MKQGIHPDYVVATVVCACGNRFETMSTQEELHVEICAVCHPFYTGKQRLVDTAGRVDRFKRKYAQVAEDEDESASEEGESTTGEGESAAEEDESTAAEGESATEEDESASEEPASKETSEEEAAQPEAAAKD